MIMGFISMSSLYLLLPFFLVSSVQPLCHPDERSALLQFKESFVINNSASSSFYAYPKTESWKLEEESGDCCSWKGVQCDNSTGHVIALDLKSSYLYAVIPAAASSVLFTLKGLILQTMSSIILKFLQRSAISQDLHT